MRKLFLLTFATSLLFITSCQNSTEVKKDEHAGHTNQNMSESETSKKPASFSAELKTNPLNVEAGKPTEFTFTVKNPSGEIVKDLQDVNGDFNQGMNTLPIVFGVKRTAKLVFVLSFIPIICIIYYINANLFSAGLLYATVYGLVLILAPLLYFTIKIGSATKMQDFHHLSTVLKWILFFGILSIVVISLNIKYNA